MVRNVSRRFRSYDLALSHAHHRVGEARAIGRESSPRVHGLTENKKRRAFISSESNSLRQHKPLLRCVRIGSPFPYSRDFINPVGAFRNRSGTGQVGLV